MSERTAEMLLPAAARALGSSSSGAHREVRSVSPTTNYLELARSVPRSAFVESCPFQFLFGRVSLKRPPRPQATVGLQEVSESKAPASTPAEPSPPLVLAIRKTQSTFPSIITLGRTANNDLLVADVSVSRVHAFFRSGAQGLEVADAGSSNGTWVGWRQLTPKGPGMSIDVGDVLRIGKVELSLRDAGTCWDLVHARVIPPSPIAR